MKQDKSQPRRARSATVTLKQSVEISVGKSQAHPLFSHLFAQPQHAPLLLERMYGSLSEKEMRTKFMLHSWQFLAYFLLSFSTIVVGQTTCGEATVVASSFETKGQSATIEVSGFDYLTACPTRRQTLNSSAVGTGRWYCYAPTRQSVVRIAMESADKSSNVKSLPKVQLFRGSLCDSLACVQLLSSRNTEFLVQANEVYYIYVFRHFSSANTEYRFSFEEVEPPSNDTPESALVLSLPHSAKHRIYGALDDLSNNACDLMQNVHGVWFSYTPTDSETLIISVASTAPIDAENVSTCSVQTRRADGSFQCEIGFAFNIQVEINVQEGETYFLLVSTPTAFMDKVGFELDVESLGPLTTTSPTVVPTNTPASSPTSKTSLMPSPI